MVNYYLDTCVYIYYFEGHSLYGAQSRELLAMGEQKEIQIIASPLIVQEVMTGLYKRDNEALEEVWAMLFGLWNIQWVDFSIEIADEAAQLSAFLNLKAPDAIHVATALASDCGVFFTNDKKLLTFPKNIPLKIELLK